MRAFVWSLALTVALLVVFAEIVTPFVRRNHPVHTLPVHKTLYLERGVDDEELYHVMAAAIEWNEATNGQVTFDIKRLPQPGITPGDAIIVLNVTPDYPEVIILDNINKYSTLGFFNNDSGLSYIAIVYERVRDEDFNAVMLHEMGHSLGLEHIKGIDGLGALMFPSIDLGASHITRTDLRQFCKLYHCDYKKMHGTLSIMDLLETP